MAEIRVFVNNEEIVFERPLRDEYAKQINGRCFASFQEVSIALACASAAAECEYYGRADLKQKNENVLKAIGVKKEDEND